MTEIEIEIKNEQGLHARPAGVFVKKMVEFKSAVEIEFNGQKKNAKSLMSVLSLGLEKNDRIKLLATGPDEGQVIQTVSQMFSTPF